MLYIVSDETTNFSPTHVSWPATLCVTKTTFFCNLYIIYKGRNLGNKNEIMCATIWELCENTKIQKNPPPTPHALPNTLPFDTFRKS